MSKVSHLAGGAAGAVLFGLAMPTPSARAQGASALLGTSALSYDTLVACAGGARLEARELALQAVGAACEDQNVRMAAAGFPRCPAQACVDRAVHRDGRPPLPVSFELGFDPVARDVWLSFRFPLGLGGSASSGWALRCRSPYDFLAWNGRLPEAEGFFDEVLAALPRCGSQPESERRATSAEERSSL